MLNKCLSNEQNIFIKAALSRLLHFASELSQIDEHNPKEFRQTPSFRKKMQRHQYLHSLKDLSVNANLLFLKVSSSAANKQNNTFISFPFKVRKESRMI